MDYHIKLQKSGMAICCAEYGQKTRESDDGQNSAQRSHSHRIFYAMQNVK